jgi:hypothetical protein
MIRIFNNKEPARMNTQMTGQIGQQQQQAGQMMGQIGQQQMRPIGIY